MAKIFKKRWAKFSFGILIVLVSFFLIRSLPAFNANLKFVHNPIRDRAARDWQKLESEIPTHPHKNLYWGDLHVHTSLSFDGYIAGVLSQPADAYRFAKGLPVNIFGKPVTIDRPLDFSAVTDHSEMIGEIYTIQNSDAPRHKRLIPRLFRSIYSTKDSLGVNTNRQRFLFNQVLKRGGGENPEHPDFFAGYATTASAWDINLKAAEDHYEPGKFTTFAGFEWSLMKGAAHLHRNILFKDMMVPDYPMSSLEIDDEYNLWLWLDSITGIGSTVMAIPHNTNLAEGGAFAVTFANGQPIDKAYAQLRQDYEPLIEVHQAKGNSEVHAGFWKNDEFSGFENYYGGTLQEQNYVRYALKAGLKIEAETGVNPFKFGMIGSTDTHSGTPGNVEESDTFLSNHGILDYFSEGRLTAQWALDQTKNVYEVINPGGLVAVWAEANTRPHIYNALKQKEVYATSGSRIQLRFFGGYDFKNQYTNVEELVKDGYEKGYPMGSDLPFRKDESPTFLIWAHKDEIGANLDRVQIIKGWHTKGGPIHEKIYTVALSDNRTFDNPRNIPSNGATVNEKTGAFCKDKGDASFFVVWTDPDFDPEASAFYYVRVIENPTASWKLWDKIRYGTAYPEGTELTVQERAWSSPIWLTPK
jgi:hypothetical protein